MEKQNRTIIVSVKNNKRKDSKFCVALVAHDGKKAEATNLSSAEILLREISESKI